jgi:hypothetical protein
MNYYRLTKYGKMASPVSRNGEGVPIFSVQKPENWQSMQDCGELHFLDLV